MNFDKCIHSYYHHLDQDRKYFHNPESFLKPLSTQALAMILISITVCYFLPVLELCYKWNHRIHNLLCLTSFVQHVIEISPLDRVYEECIFFIARHEYYMSWYPIVLICISLVSNNVKYLFLCIMVYFSFKLIFFQTEALIQ